MRKSITQTEIVCDTCGHTILRPLSVSEETSKYTPYFNFIDTDLCGSCSIKILYRLLSSKKITEDTLKDVMEDYKIFQYSTAFTEKPIG